MTSSLGRWLVAGAAALACAGTATIVRAQPADQASAKQLYDDGEKAYNLGQFDKAIELFTKAYEQYPEPAFLFNIAQAYRQAGNCKQALFFYKRFLSLKEGDTKKPIKPEMKKDVEGRIAELEDCVKRDIANKPPDSLDPTGTGGTGTTGTGTTGTGTTGTGTTGTTGTGTTGTGTTGTGTTRVATNGTGTGDENSTEQHEVPATPEVFTQPKLVDLRLAAGAGKLLLGKLNGPVEFTLALTGGYPLHINDQLQISLGAAITFTPVPYNTPGMTTTANAQWITVMANVAPEYLISPRMSVRADIGAGVLLFSGLTNANPFTDNQMGTTGAVSSFALRAAASFSYMITNNVLAQATIGDIFATAPAHFSSDVSSMQCLQFMAGVGYRM